MKTPKYGEQATVTTEQGERVEGTVINHPSSGTTYVESDSGYIYHGPTETAEPKED